VRPGEQIRRAAATQNAYCAELVGHFGELRFRWQVPPHLTPDLPPPAAWCTPSPGYLGSHHRGGGGAALVYALTMVYVHLVYALTMVYALTR
jgi:hypothetical protein